MEVSDIITISNNKQSITQFIIDNKNEMRAQTVFALNSYIARMEWINRYSIDYCKNIGKNGFIFT